VVMAQGPIASERFVGFLPGRLTFHQTQFLAGQCPSMGPGLSKAREPALILFKQ
jgi:hypothetical protein